MQEKSICFPSLISKQHCQASTQDSVMAVRPPTAPAAGWSRTRWAVRVSSFKTHVSACPAPRRSKNRLSFCLVQGLNLNFADLVLRAHFQYACKVKALLLTQSPNQSVCHGGWKSSISWLMGMFGLKIKPECQDQPFKECHSKHVLAVKVESERRWVPRGLPTIMWCPDHNSQVQKRPWTYRDWRTQRGRNWKGILRFPNIHEEVLPNSVCDKLVAISASKMGIPGK